MGDRLSVGLIVGALAMALGVAAPISTSAQEKKDRSTATNAAEETGPLVSRSKSGSAADGTASAEPNSPAPSPTSYDWNGGYIGGHISWGTGRANTTFSPLPNAAQFIDMRPTTLTPDPSGFSGGAQGGYNWQSGHFIIGGEADISWSRLGGTGRVSPIIMNNSSAFPSNGFLIARQEIKWFGTLRPRVGIAFDRVLLYGTAGLAYGQVNYSANADFRPSTPTSISFFQYPASFGKTKTGWTVGGGAEVAISKHWSWKAEYLYYNLGNESTIANPVPANPPFQVAYSWETKVNMFSTGLNFRF